MNALAVFGLSILLSATSSLVVAVLFVWPWLRTGPSQRALLALTTPHMFLRFIGLSVLVPGVVAPSLPSAWAVPTAYGDLVAGLLAVVATVALARGASWALSAVWSFNVWGALDLLFGFYQGLRAGLQPGSLGAAFYLITAIVPPLLVSHALLFGLLVKTSVQSKRPHATPQPVTLA